MIGLLLLCLLALVLGAPVGRRLPLPKLGQGAVAFTLGLGALSLVFAVLFFLGNADRASLLFVCALSGVGLAALSRRWPSPVVPAASTLTLLGKVAAFVCGSGVFVTIASCLKAPWGQWDSWTIWSLRGRAMFTLSQTDLDPSLVTRVGVGIHPEYPMLVPGVIASAWVLDGGGPLYAPLHLAMGFFLLTLVLVVTWISDSRGIGAGLAVGAVWATCRFTNLHAAEQYADILLSALWIVSFWLLLKIRSGDRSIAVFLALGGVLGLSAWCKHEGLLFALTVIGIVAGTLAIDPQRERRTPAALAFCSGLAPGLCVLAYFKLCLSPAGDLASSIQDGEHLRLLLDGQRWREILRLYGEELVSPGRLVSYAAMFMACIALGGHRPRMTPAVKLLIPIVAIHGVAYTLAYLLVSPDHLTRHLQTSLPRLHSQFFPLILGAIALSTLPRPSLPLQSTAVNSDKATRFKNRETGEIQTERVFGEAGLWFLNHWLLGKIIEYFVFCRWPISWAYGVLQRARFSRRKIPGFAQGLGIDVSEARRSIDQFESLDDFFCRRLKPEARPIDPDPDHLISPADGRVLVFPSIEAGRELSIKGSLVTIPEMIGDPELAKAYEGGDVIVVRLCPADYHRFHFPEDGEASAPVVLPGPLHSVHPIALSGGARSFLNKRAVCRLKTERFGQLLLIEVGAMLVGTIEQTYTPGPVKRGDDKGTFHFGGSTTVVLAEPGRLTIDTDLVEASREGLETLVKYGTRIACRRD